MRRLLLYIVVPAALAALAPVTSEAVEFEFDFQKILPAGPETRLELTFAGGDLTLTSGEQDRIVIEATKRVKAVTRQEAEEIADHIEIKVRQDGNDLTVVTNYLFMRERSESFWQKVLGLGGTDSFGRVDWSVQVPDGCGIVVHNSNGKIMVSHIRSDLEIRSSSAEIQLTGIEGRVNVESTSGSTVGELLFGPVTVQQAQGMIDLQFVEGDIRIKSSSADINVLQDMGSLDLTTSTGNVTLQTNLDSSKDYFVETESGNINVSIPETSSGNIRIESQTGDIKTEVPIAIKSMSRKQVEGVFGFGGVTVNLVSISGDVTVAQF